jgi:hypothetical protein
MITEIIKQIRDQQSLLKKEIVPDPRTMATQLGNLKRAENEINHLFVDLRSEVQKNLVLILATGKNSSQFASIAEQSFGCLSFKAESVYERLAQNVHETFLGKPASPSIVEIAISNMSDIAYEIGIVGYNMPMFKSTDTVQLNTQEDVQNLIQTIFVRDVGAELVTLMAVHDAAKKILETDFEGKRVPVILHTTNKELADAIAKDSTRLTNKIFTVNCTKEQTEKTVEDKLKELSKKAQGGE